MLLADIAAASAHTMWYKNIQPYDDILLVCPPLLADLNQKNIL